MNKGNPVVSVVISTHNRASLLPRAVRSVLEQTYTDLELVIVDDASSDDTRSLAENFKDDRVRYIRHEAERGGPAARNTGIKAARGKYIAFLDDDDEWLPEKLEKQAGMMESSGSGTGVIYTGFELVKEGKREGVKFFPEHKGGLKKALLYGSVIGSVSRVLVKRECFDRAGLFDEDLTSCQDWDMWLRISDYYDFDFVPEILTKVYEHGTQISNDMAALIPGRTRMVKKHMDEFRQYPDALVIHLKRLGKLNFLNGSWREGAKWFAEAVRVRPAEAVRITGWILFEMVPVKYFSKMSKFRKYKA